MSKPTDPTGCVLLRRLLHQPVAAWKKTSPSLVKVFQECLSDLPRLPQVLDPVCRIDLDERFDDVESLKPPFEQMYIEGVGQGLRVGTIITTDTEKTAEGNTIIYMLSYLQRFNSPHPECGGYAMLEIDDNGTAQALYTHPQMSGGGWEPGSDESDRFQGACVIPAMLTIQIMTADNVGLVEQQHDRAVRKRLRQTNAVDASEKYYVLTLRDQRARGESQPTGQTGMMPLHVARGHWARYGPQYGNGLLFGRIAKKVWVPDHDRGKAKNGIRRKSYKLAAKPAEAFPATPSEAVDQAAAFNPCNVDRPQPQEARS